MTARMTARRALAAALVLPLAGLGASWGWADRAAQQGTVWHVPIAGHDPRDVLRGHYVVFTYRWPGLEGGGPVPETLCLEGNAPDLARVFAPRGQACDAFVHAPRGWNGSRGGLESGRLYLPRERARALERQLADPLQQGIVHIRVREDGRPTPLDITFRPRSDAAAPAR